MVSSLLLAAGHVLVLVLIGGFCVCQELVRKQEALRNEILAQQGIMMRLSREVASIKHERNTLAAIDHAMNGAPSG